MFFLATTLFLTSDTTSYASSNIADYDFSAHSGNTHPFLLFNQNEIGKIQERVQSSSVVATALSKTGQRGSGENTDHWDRDLIDSSIHYLLDGNNTSLNKAITNFADHTSGTNKVIFQSASNHQDYNYQGPCTSLALSYDFLYQNLDSKQKEDGKNTLADMATSIYGTYKDIPYQAGHNFSSGVVGCLGIIGVTLDGEHPQASTWREYAKHTLVNYLYDTSYNSGGDYLDGHVYQYYGQGAPLLFAASYKKKYGQDIIGNTGISNIWDYSTYELMSNNKFPRYGDSSKITMINGEDFYILQKKAREGSAKAPGWLWTWNQIRGQNLEKSDYSLWKQYDLLGILLYYPTTIEAINPSQLSQFKSISVFPSNAIGDQDNRGGMAYLRDSWHNGKNVTLTLVNRWRWQNHQHYDPNHFILSAFGEGLIVNENNWTYQDPNRGKLSQQNTILFDVNSSNADMPRGNFNSGTSPGLGMFTTVINQPDADMIISDSRYPHNNWSLQPGILQNGIRAFWSGNLSNITPINTANRSVLFQKSYLKYPFFVMLDEFNIDGHQHDYTWQAHVPLNATGYTGQGTAEQPIKFSKNNATLSMVFATSTNFSQRLLPKEEKRNDRALQITQSNVANSQILSLLLPTNNRESYSVQKELGDNYQAFTISDGDKESIVIFNPQATSINYEQISTDAKLLVLEKSNNQYNKYSLYHGKQLAIDNTNIFSSTDTVNCIGRVGESPSCSNQAVVSSPANSNDSQTCAETRADINCDGVVNKADYDILISRFNF